MIAVIDYGMGNIGSVCNALSNIGVQHKVTGDPDIILKSDALVLPGVGAFGDAMNNIIERGLDDFIRDFIGSGKPFLGICLGYQLLYPDSEESPGIEGLGIFKGTVRKFSDDMGLKVPHMGWNTIKTNDKMKILSQSNGKYMYFVHSYYVDPAGMEEYSAFTEYGIRFASAVEYENVLACQFHPEKSGDAGMAVLKKWTEGISC